MVKPPLARHDAHLVIPEALNSNNLVIIGQELGLDWRIWHPKVHDARYSNGAQSKKEEDNLRLSESRLQKDRTIEIATWYGFIGESMLARPYVVRLPN